MDMNIELATQKFRGIKDGNSCNGEFRGTIEISSSSYNNIYFYIKAVCSTTNHHARTIQNKLNDDTGISFRIPYRASYRGLHTNNGVPQWELTSKTIKIDRIKKVLKNLKKNKYKVISEDLFMKKLTVEMI